MQNVICHWHYFFFQFSQSIMWQDDCYFSIIISASVLLLTLEYSKLQKVSNLVQVQLVQVHYFDIIFHFE